MIFVSKSKEIIFSQSIGKMNELGFTYKTGKDIKENQHSRKRKFFKQKVLPKGKWNKKRGVFEKTKKGSRKKKLIWID